MAVKQAQAKRKQQLKPGLHWLKPVLALATMTGSVIGLTMMLDWMRDPYQWPVQTVNIKGKFEHLQQTQLKKEVAPLASEGFFGMNVRAIQERLQNLPWVEQVSVRRVWPDQLSIVIREQQPVAYWGEKGFLNPLAQVFEPEQSVDLPALPRFEGPDGYEQRVLLMYRQLQGMLKPLQLSVGSLRLDARRTWRVQLSNDLTVEIGRRNPVHRIARFVRVYPAILAAGSGQVRSVDLRYSNGFAVRRQQVDKKAESTG
jgi:cell division protein FtsQ